MKCRAGGGGIPSPAMAVTGRRDSVPGHFGYGAESGIFRPGRLVKRLADPIRRQAFPHR